MSKEEGAVTHKGIHAAYVAAFSEIGAAIKSAKGHHAGKMYADITAVIETIKPSLTRNGLAFMQTPSPNPDGAEITTVLIHETGQHMDLGTVFIPSDKKDAQRFGSAMTYARRYALVSAFGVPTEDDDGHAATNGGGSARQPQQRPAQSSAPRQAPQPARGGMPDGPYNDLMAALAAARLPDSFIIEKYRVKSVRDLGSDAYAHAMEQLKAKAAQIAAEATNGEFAGLDVKGFDQ